MYCRLDLNVRSTTHLLLAFAAIHKPCRHFLPLYFSKAVVLPTDWTSVADLVQTFDSDLYGGSLPAILRKCMVEKFTEFDEYQLAKHGKKVKKQDIPIFCSEQDEQEEGMEIEAQQSDDDEKNKKKELAKRRFSVKRLIRLLHISAPVYHVMAILGKK